MTDHGGPKVKCLTCGAVIQSTYRHDFVRCSCPMDSDTSIFIDGGSAYTRMGYGSLAKYEWIKDDEQ